MRVHLVDDTPAIAEWLADALEIFTTNVVTKVTTSDFIQLLQPEPWEGVDVAVVDIMLPGVSGIEILTYLMNDHPQVKRICMTASLPGAMDVTGLADHVLVKPFNVGELLNHLGAEMDLG